MDLTRDEKSEEDHPGFARLTARERECLRALREHGETKLAARSLSIGPATFNDHLASARRKLGVGRSWEAVRLLSARDRAGEGHSPEGDRIAGQTVESPVRHILDDVIGRLGVWAGPLFVGLTATAMVLAAVLIWAAVELALRFESLV